MTTTEKLAEALRRLVNTFPIPVDGVEQADRSSLRLALFAAREALAAHEAAAKGPNADAQDAIRWRTFIGLPYAIRAEWAANLSLAPVLTQWVDSEAKGATNA